jgi:hypothetical protein
LYSLSTGEREREKKRGRMENNIFFKFFFLFMPNLLIINLKYCMCLPRLKMTHTLIYSFEKITIMKHKKKSLAKKIKRNRYTK